MGQRTQNHLIEDESRLFFKKSLPKYWVCRDKNDDYGIDCEVEIFNENGDTTGLVFWVQLKGTDSTKDKTIKNIYFKNEKIIQFTNYDIPVLIVRYSTFKKIFYFRWSKNITNFKSETKNINVSFYELNLWNDDSHIEIISYLEKQSIIKKGKVKFPIKTIVLREDYEESKSNIPYSNITNIKRCLESQKKYFSLSKNINDSLLQIKVDKNQIVMSFSDFAFSTMKIDFPLLEEKHFEELTKYILIIFAQTLFDIGKNNLGNDVIFDNNLLSIIKTKKEYIISILHHLIQGNYFEETINELTAFFQESEDDNILEIILSVLLISNKKSFDENKLLLYETFLKEQLNISEKRKNKLGIATASYNLGNYNRSKGNYLESLKFYLKARKFNLDYKSQSYYYYELAGVLFLLNKFNFASKFYSKSLELNTDYHLAKALLADSLMYSGNYLAAQNKIDEFLNEQTNLQDNDEWLLKYSCLKTLIENGHPTSQIRDEKLAIIHTKNGDYEKALECDFLYDLAWFNYGIQELQANNIESAFIAFAFSALLCNNDIEAWTNATLSGFNEKIDPTLLIFVIRVAYYYNGINYLNYVSNQLKLNNPESLDNIMEFIDSIVEEKKEEPIMIRYFDNENEYTKIDIKPRH